MTDVPDLFAPLPASPTISVALTTYNSAQFLEEQLNSFLTQTRLPVELVVSDDGSTDDTLAIIAAFAQRAPFAVRVLEKNARLGFADNFLFAASQCRGDLVAFSDQDDVWLPGKLETGLGRIVRDNSLLSLHRLTVTDGSLHPVRTHAQGIAGDAVFGPLELDPESGWGNTMMFRRELATLIPREDRPQHPGLDRKLSHDTWLYTVAAAIGRVSHIAESLILYRQHGSNTAGVTAPSLAGRAKGIYVDPTTGIRLNLAFNESLSPLFSALAERTDGEARDHAIAAAVRFAQRADRLAHRLDLYERTSLTGRLRAYAAMLRSLQGDQPAWQRAHKVAAKDFVLGVTGLDRRAKRTAARKHPAP